MARLAVFGAGNVGGAIVGHISGGAGCLHLVDRDMGAADRPRLPEGMEIDATNRTIAGLAKAGTHDRRVAMSFLFSLRAPAG